MSYCFPPLSIVKNILMVLVVIGPTRVAITMFERKESTVIMESNTRLAVMTTYYSKSEKAKLTLFLNGKMLTVATGGIII